MSARALVTQFADADEARAAAIDGVTARDAPPERAKRAEAAPEEPRVEVENWRSACGRSRCSRRVNETGALETGQSARAGGMPFVSVTMMFHQRLDVTKSIARREGGTPSARVQRLPAGLLDSRSV